MTFFGFIRAEYGFAEIFGWLSDKHSQLFSSSAAHSLWDMVTGALPAVWLGVLILLLSLVQVFFGRKLLKVENTLFFAYVGFLLGEYVLTSIVPLQILPWILGIIIGIMLAIAAKDLYYIMYGFVGVYVPFCILYGGHYLPESISAITMGNLIIGLAVSAIIGFLFFLIRRSVECIFTSAIGAVGFLAALNILLGEFFGIAIEGLVSIIVIAVFTIVGAVVQRFLIPSEDEAGL